MTLAMDERENDDDVQLTKENFRRVCRLCLHGDEDLVGVLHGIDENPLKRLLAERVYDLYQIKVSCHFSEPNFVYLNENVIFIQCLCFS